MSPEQFRRWRKSLGLKQREAAELLGLKKRVIQYYETGKRDGKSVQIPQTVRLACHALSNGVRDYDGESAVLAAPAADSPIRPARPVCVESKIAAK